MTIEIGKTYKLINMPEHVVQFNGTLVKVRGSNGGLHDVYQIDDEQITGCVTTENLQPVDGYDEITETKQSVPTNIVTLHDAIRFEMQQKKPKYSPFEEHRIKEGLCPRCGKKGHYHLSTPICDEHGPY